MDNHLPGEEIWEPVGLSMAQPLGTRPAAAETVAVFEPNVTGRGTYPAFCRLANPDLDMPKRHQYSLP